MRTLSPLFIALFSLISVGARAADNSGAWLRLAAAGPGTQTEDELYIGARMKREAARQEAQAKEPRTTGSPAFIALPPSQKAEPAKQMQKAVKPLKTGDEDLEDLEIQRAR